MTTRKIFEERRQAVADQITTSPEQFNMGYWATKHQCGTVACLAGWAVLLSGRKVEVREGCVPGFVGLGEAEVIMLAAEWLGVPHPHAGALFWGKWIEDDRYLSEIEAAEAADVLLAAPYVEAPDA